uniref:Uncharacterized protein n=1 Tax=Leptobrachium leishanense TaxID=445787 RepID=A0A8C5PRP9_9ANUR
MTLLLVTLFAKEPACSMPSNFTLHVIQQMRSTNDVN